MPGRDIERSMTDSTTPPLTKQARVAALQAMLLKLISDGQLTNEEMTVLHETRDALQLTPQDVQGIRAEVYHATLRELEGDGRISAREAELLDRMLQFLNGVPWAEPTPREQ